MPSVLLDKRLRQRQAKTVATITARDEWKENACLLAAPEYLGRLSITCRSSASRCLARAIVTCRATRVRSMISASPAAIRLSERLRRIAYNV
jgi:hypothetical protein